MMSFQEIADILSRESGRTVSRQSVQQTYNNGLRKLRAHPVMVGRLRGLADLLQSERRERVRGGMHELRELSTSSR